MELQGKDLNAEERIKVACVTCESLSGGSGTSIAWPLVPPLATPQVAIAEQGLELKGDHLYGALLAYHLSTPLSYHA